MVNQLQLNNRQREIYKTLINKGEVKINELTKQFNVVEMTIRRDFEKMERLGLIKRTFGGAIPAVDPYKGLIERETLNEQQKNMIGVKAAQFVKEGEAIFVDAGTTTPHLVKNLPLEWEMIIVTNALNVAAQIQGAKKEKILLGGILSDSTSSIVGPTAETMLDNMSFNRSFLAASGLTLEQGFSNANAFEVQIKQKVMKHSQEVNFLVDYSKFGEQFIHKISMFEGIDRIITDKEPPAGYRQFFTHSGIDLVICS